MARSRSVIIPSKGESTRAVAPARIAGGLGEADRVGHHGCGIRRAGDELPGRTGRRCKDDCPERSDRPEANQKPTANIVFPTNTDVAAHACASR